MLTFTELQFAELRRARARHKGANSPHEGYAIIMEEVDEFWDEVKKRDHNKQAMLDELVQIAAMCQRVAEDTIMDMAPRLPRTS